MIKTKGITLLELLIAISLLVLVLFAGSGIFLSSQRIFLDARFIAQAQRNAMVPMMHMIKQLQQLAGIYQPPAEPPPPTALIRFLTYSNPPDFPNGPTELHTYAFNQNENQILYDGNIIANHISNNPSPQITQSVDHGRILLTIEITATDNNGNNPYTLQTNVEARYVVVPPVY